MISKIAIFITKELEDLKIISDIDYEIYEYGAKMLIEQVVCVVFMGITFLVEGNFLRNSFYLMVLMCLRTFTGGIHLKTFYQCFILSLLVTVISIIFMNLFCLPEKTCILVMCILMVCIIKRGPIENKNFQLNKSEIKHMKKGIIFIEVGSFMLTYILSHNNIFYCYNATIAAHIVVWFSMEMEGIKRKWDEWMRVCNKKRIYDNNNV